MNKQEQQQVLDCIKGIGPCGARKISATLDMDWQDVRDHLESLRHDGFVKQQSNSQWVSVSTSKPSPGHPWKTGAPEPKPTGSSVADMVKDGTLTKPEVSVMQMEPISDGEDITDRKLVFGHITTDELIKQVKQGEKAREELRRRVGDLI